MKIRLSKKISKIFLTFAVICLALLGTSVRAQADEGGYTIKNYKVYGTLHENNVMDVKEVITVNFTEPRHGIYRYINTYYSLYRDTSSEGDGTDVRLMSYFAYVSDFDVKGYAFEEDSDNSDGYTYCVRIGDEDELVSGKQTYEITYKYVMRDDRISASDFFFYSVLGSGWETNIKKFSFEIDFDKELPQSAIDDFQVFSGTYGNDGNDLNVKTKVTASKITGKVKKVGPNQAISLFLNLPEGYFTDEETTSPIPFYVCMVLAMALAVFIIIHELTKKDKKEIVTVEFYPPEGLSPADIGTIIDESADDKDILALIPYWADQGYLTIHMDPKPADGRAWKSEDRNVSVTKKKDIPEDVPDYQKKFFWALFSSGDTVKFSDLDEDFVKAMDEVKNEVGVEYTTGVHQLSTGDLGGATMCIAAALFYGLALAFSSKLDLLYNVASGIFAFFPLAGIAILRICLVKTDRIRKTGGKVLSVIVIAVLLLIAFGGMSFAGIDDNYLATPINLISFGVTAVAMVFAGNLVHATDYKKQVIGKVLGLRQFIQTAEIPKLKMLMEADSEYFYHILPYAMALDLSDQWAELFKELDLTRPSWYYCNDRNMMFDAYYFNHCFYDGATNSISVTRADIAASESSSSSGGGGFSGGGGGGGGGGSW